MAMRDLWRQFLSALLLLTRLPLPVIARPAGAEAAWAWPLAGAVVGAGAAVVAGAATAAGLPAGVAAGLVIAAQLLLTGALHEDGLADCADGFWGGRTPARRLEIMKDSRIGSYGTLALIVVLLTRWAALSVLVATPLALVAVAALSRVPMAILSAWLRNARGEGLSARVGRVGRLPALTGAALATLFAAPLIGWAALPALAAALATGLAAGLVARRKIGGQTGDVLGAAQVLADLAVLCVLVAV